MKKKTGLKPMSKTNSGTMLHRNEASRSDVPSHVNCFYQSENLK